MTPSVGSSWILRSAIIPGRDVAVDLGVIDGVFVPPEECSNCLEIDLQHRLVIPGFVDAHMHLDKAFALESNLDPGDSLPQAIANFYDWRSQVAPAQIFRNARRVAEQAVINGTRAIRTHTTVDQALGMDWVESLLRVKDELSDQLDIQIVAFPDTIELLEGKAKPLIYEALRLGVDLVGGAPLFCENPKRAIDLLFEIAGEADCDLDLHVDETDDPEIGTLEYIAERKLALGFQGRVVAGHCSSLSAMDDRAAKRVIEKVAQAGLYIITLPACNLFLLGRSAGTPGRRGLTRVRELLQAGVKVAYASDNIRDAFNPFGNADMLQQALICAYAVQFGTKEELDWLLKMGVEYPAEALRLSPIRFQTGEEASFTVLDAPDWGSALARLANRRYVFHKGYLVAQTTKEVDLSAARLETNFQPYSSLEDNHV